MDQKQLTFLMGALGVIAIVGAAYILLTPKALQGGEEKKTVDTAYIESLQMGMDPKSIPELKGIITGPYESYTRERAIIALSDLSAFNGDTQGTIDFLKGVASNETDENVRVAAFSNIHALREQNPAKIDGAMDIQASGDFKPNSTIEFFAEVTSVQGSDDIIVNLDNLWRVRENGTFMEGFDVNPTRPYYISLPSGGKRVLPFNLTVPEEGEYIVNFRMKIGEDRFDSKVFKKDVYLTVSKNGGGYTAADAD